MRKSPLTVTGLEDVRGAEEDGRLLEAGKGWGVGGRDLPSVPAEGAHPCWLLDFSPLRRHILVRRTSDLRTVR